MRRFKTLASILIVLLLLLLLSSSISAAGPDAPWLTYFYYDFPPGTWAEGSHTYQFEFTWTQPTPGSHLTQQGEFTVSADAPLYPGRVLLRSFYELAFAAPDCARIDTVNPDQPTRFHIGWLTDEPMTASEARAHFESMSVTAVADGQPSVEMQPTAIMRWTEERSNALDRVICGWTMRR
jgi:hypothetical protein